MIDPAVMVEWVRLQRTVSFSDKEIAEEFCSLMNQAAEYVDDLRTQLVAAQKLADDRGVEVERLRAALQVIAELPIPEQDGFMSANMREIASVALRNSKP